jgi:hypothetical protein
MVRAGTIRAPFRQATEGLHRYTPTTLIAHQLSTPSLLFTTAIPLPPLPMVMELTLKTSRKNVPVFQTSLARKLRATPRIGSRSPQVTTQPSKWCQLQREAIVATMSAPSGRSQSSKSKFLAIQQVNSPGSQGNLDAVLRGTMLKVRSFHSM